MSVFLFPGQGSQKLGMGKELADHFPKAREVFDEVDNALNFKLSDIIWGDDADLLNRTENTQPALLAASVAAFRAIKEPAADFVLGHSLGEYSALVCAGALSLSDAAVLLRKRGEAMKSAATGKMMAILGLDAEKVNELCDSIENCYLANDNCPGQVVISGTDEAIAAAEPRAKDMGAKRALVLPVSVPAHCPLMAPAMRVMEQELADTVITAPKIKFASNRTAEIDDNPEAIKQHLAQQMINGVRFRECVDFLAKNGVDKAFELGSGAVLGGLVKRISDKISTTSIETKEGVENYEG